MKNLLSGIIKRANIFIGIIIIITVFFGFNAAKIVINPDFYSIFPQQSERVSVLLEETGISDTLEMHMYLSVEIKGETTPEALKLFADVLKKIENHPNIRTSINPFNFITFRKSGGRLSIEPIAAEIPSNEAETALFLQRLNSEPLAQGFVTSDSGRILSALFVSDSDADPALFTKDFERMIEPLNSSFKVYYSGDLPFAAQTSEYLQKDLALLVSLAVLVILVVLFASFRVRRALFLPVITVGVGAVWALGFSVMMGYKLTVVSVVLPTIVLAIGSSYSVHILSEYFRGFGQSEDNFDPAEKICIAVSHVMKTVILAGLTTMIGFCSLLFTSITPVREFALSVSFGIFACVILSLFFLPSLLSKLSPPNPKHSERIKIGLLNRMIDFISVGVVRFYPLFIVLFIVSLLLAFFLYPDISRKVDYIDYFPSGDKIVIDTYKIAEFTGGGQVVNITLKAPDGTENYFLQQDVMKRITALQDEISRNENVISLMSFYTILEQINGVMFNQDGLPEKQGLILLLSRYFKLLGDRDITFAADADFINGDYSQITIFLRVYDGETGKVIADRDILYLINDLQEVVDRYVPDKQPSYIWGNTVLFFEAGDQIQRDQLFSTALAMILIVFVSLIFFRSLLLGLFSLIPLVFAIALNYILMVVLQIPLDVTTVLVSNAAIGVGVDDAIHFLLQYRAQLDKCDNNYKNAVLSTFRITGRPIVLTTVSIVAGLLVLCFASFKPIVYFGLLVSISLTAAMVSTLLFLPAFILGFNRIKGIRK